MGPDYSDSLVMPFGKYKGMKVKDVMKIDPGYFANFLFPVIEWFKPNEPLIKKLFSEQSRN